MNRMTEIREAPAMPEGFSRPSLLRFDATRGRGKQHPGRPRHKCRGGLRSPEKMALKNIKMTKRTHLMDLRFAIHDLRASCSIAQAFSFGVAKTKRGHNKTCNFAKRSQISRRLVFQSSCYGAGICERFMVIFPMGNF